VSRCVACALLMLACTRPGEVDPGDAALDVSPDVRASDAAASDVVVPPDARARDAFERVIDGSAPGCDERAERCNGADDDCDERIDEGFGVGASCSIGVGACARAGVVVCAEGEGRCDGEPGAPREEVCDGVDGDCDGRTDEGCAEDHRPTGVPDGFVAGVQRGVPEAEILARGWRRCYAGTYDSEGEPLAGVLEACRGERLLIACREVDDLVFRVAAEGRFEEVTRDVGPGAAAVNTHNEVDFYFSRSASWGFAPAGAGVNRNTCDTAEDHAEERMCWHTRDGDFRGGWRCGASTRLNASSAFERVVFTRTETALGAGRGFGHHGECGSFNGCIDAATCAEAACRHAGQGRALSWREGGCLDVPDLDCDLFRALPDDLDTEWAGACNMPVAYDVVCVGTPPPVVPLRVFEGARADVSDAALAAGGYEICLRQRYDEVFSRADAMERCAGQVLVVGCRPVGARRLTVAAMGDRDAIFQPVPDEAGAFQVHNGAHWYFGEDFSFGFAPEGAAVNRQPCDTDQERAELRLCWHTIDRGGWRCGATTGLNDSDDWERVILQGGLR